ncbi:MAG TPA: hypothetical protein VK034_30925, partial [Enhygromyxa sp.]|nr:hypothetical protein [Enhygromyxa sp.]
RRRRFIALAISGLATAGCKRASPEPCLSIEVTPEPDGQPEQPGPFVEDPGAPLETGETGDGETGETGEALDQTPPEVCLKVAPPSHTKPRPCLKKRPPPQPCLMIL